MALQLQAGACHEMAPPARAANVFPCQVPIKRLKPCLMALVFVG